MGPCGSRSTLHFLHVVLTGCWLRQQWRSVELNTWSLRSSSPVDLHRHHQLCRREHLPAWCFACTTQLLHTHSLHDDTTEQVSMVLCVTRTASNAVRTTSLFVQNKIMGTWSILFVLCAMSRQSCLCHCLYFLYPCICCSSWNSSVECAHT